jgi:chromosome segregation ATPase
MSIVSEKKFLTEEEKTKLKEIQTNTRSLIGELGEIELIKLQLETRYNSAKTFLDELTTQEKEFTKKVFEIYGKCTIDPETGEITVVE